jgi:hypothetical protein
MQISTYMRPNINQNNPKILGLKINLVCKSTSFQPMDL